MPPLARGRVLAPPRPTARAICLPQRLRPPTHSLPPWATPQTKLAVRRWQSSQPSHQQHSRAPEPSPFIKVTHRTSPRLRFLAFALYTLVFYSAASYLTSASWVTADSEDEAIGDEDAEIVIEETLFLPLDFSRKIPGQPYKGSDPEWQDFVKLSKDHSLQKTLRDELAHQVLDGAARSPALGASLGNNAQVTQYWLDCIYPNTRPPSYSRNGIALFPGGIGLMEETVSHSEYVRRRHLLYPSAWFMGAWGAAKTYFYLKKVKVKAYMGMAVTPLEYAHLQFAAGLQDAVLRLLRSRLGPASGAEATSNSAVTETVQQNARSAMGASLTPTDTNTVNHLRSPGPRDPSRAGELLQSMWAYTDMGIALTAGYTHFQHEWMQSSHNMYPEGACYFDGDVELKGSKGRAKLQVRGAYIPREDKWAYVMWGPKHVWELKQRPLGGN